MRGAPQVVRLHNDGPRPGVPCPLLPALPHRLDELAARGLHPARMPRCFPARLARGALQRPHTRRHLTLVAPLPSPSEYFLYLTTVSFSAALEAEGLGPVLIATGLRHCASAHVAIARGGAGGVAGARGSRLDGWIINKFSMVPLSSSACAV